MKAHSAAFLTWVLIQLLTLSIGAARVPISARAGSDPQHLALSEIIIVQVAMSSMMLPVLSSNGTAAAVALSALPFLRLAAFLSGAAVISQLAVALALLMWITGLRIWQAAIRSKKNQMVVVAVLNCVVIGGPVVSYLIGEFSDGPELAGWKLRWISGPLVAVISQASATKFAPVTLEAAAVLLISGVIAWAFREENSSRDRLSTSILQGKK